MTSASYPGFVQLLRLLGREDALAALGVSIEPDPSELTDSQRAALSSLLEQRLKTVAAELVQEAAVSDDVHSAESARIWLKDRIAGYGELVGSDIASRLLAISVDELRLWEREA